MPKPSRADMTMAAMYLRNDIESADGLPEEEIDALTRVVTWLVEQGRTGRRCARHDPQPTGDGLGHVQCAKCGMQGLLSNGRPRAGRPQKIIWLRRLASQEN